VTADQRTADQLTADQRTADVSQLQPELLERPASGQTAAVVLVLYGGRATSSEPSRPWHLSAARMVPFARMLYGWGRDRGVAVCTVRYRVRGWNGSQLSPVHDARWALEEIRRRHGDVPVVLVGHSMGGRTAMRVADAPTVVAAIGLAPWLPRGEPVDAVRGRRVLVVHGTADRWTSPAESLLWCERARPLTSGMRRLEVSGAGHFMLRRVRLWNSVTCLFVQDALADRTARPSDTKTHQVVADELRLTL